MKNKMPFLVLVCCMLFCIPCYADDVEIESDISINDVIVESDISANENIIDNYEVELFSTPLMAIEDNSEFIDYSEYFETMLDFLTYFRSSATFIDDSYIDLSDLMNGHNISFDGDLAYIDNILLRDFVGLPDYAELYDSSIDVSDGFAFITYIYSNGFTSRFADIYIEFDSNFIITYCDATNGFAEFSYDYAYEKTDLTPIIDNLKHTNYLLLFLVLERVLYIGWDLFSKIGGSRNE